MKTILSLILALSFLSAHSQVKYDTSEYRQVTLVKIDPSMVGGGKGWKLTVTSINPKNDSLEIAWIYQRTIDRETRKHLGLCVWLDKYTFERAVEETNFITQKERK